MKQTDGLLLFRCATESQFDGTKRQLRALKILMSLTFNNEAKVLFKKQQLQTLVTSSKIPDFQKVADGGILWRLFPKYETTDQKSLSFPFLLHQSETLLF